jgi:DNA (cytosine-5)-methyltransferase 1
MVAKKAHIDRLKHIRAKLDQRLDNHQRVVVNTSSQNPIRGFNFVDLFSGAGGNSCGLKQAGFNGLLSVEIDKDASETHRINFPKCNHFEGDIRKISETQIKEAIGGKTVHIMAAGFPCQGFSMAGKTADKISNHFKDGSLTDEQLYELDERNFLYKEVVRFAKILKPWYLVMENVPGIVNMAHGKFVNSIIRDFDEAGYSGLSVSILESAAYGVPQIRPRAIFVGNRFDMPNPYPKSILSVGDYASIESAIDDLRDRKRDSDTNHEWTDHRPDMIKRISKVEPGHSLYKTYTDANKRQYKGKPAMTIKENHGTTHIHYDLDRTLSAREMARLQSFPDSFKFSGRMKRVFWQVGNAAPPLLFKHLGLAVTPQLQQIEKSL